MTFFNRKLVSNIIHNGKKFLVSSKYMEGNPTCLTVKTENADQIFKIKCITQFSSCKDVAIDWGDGIQETYEYDDTTRVHDISHTYSAAGEYDILISNTVSKLEVVDVNDKCFKIKLTIDGTEDSIVFNQKTSLADIKEFIEQDVQSKITGDYDKDNGVWNEMSYTYIDLYIEDDVEKQQTFEYLVEDVSNERISKYAVLKLKQLGSNVKELGEECFLGAVNMVEANFENSELATIGNSAFNGVALSSVNIPSSVTAVGKDAFANCNNLKSLTIDGKNIKNFGEGVCKYDYALKYVDLPYAIDDNAESAFCCTGVFTPDVVKNPYAADLSIPDGWKSIPKDCFAGMPQLSTCVIPSSVSSIQHGAFADVAEPYVIVEDGVSTEYSPCMNGLQKIVFTGSNIVKAFKTFKTTMKKTFSTVGSIDSAYGDATARDYCKDEDVEKAVAKAIEPKIDLIFLNDSMQDYQYWKAPCCNKSVDEALSALVKYTNYFDSFPTVSCQYVITWDVHSSKQKEIWGETETFDVVKYTVEKSDADSVKSCNEVILSGLVYTPQPTVLTIEDPDALDHRPKQISVYNDKVFTVADMHQLQNDVIDISFGKYSTLSIADNAVANCPKLRSVYIPATLTYIGKNAFANDTALKDVQFKRSRSVFVDEGAFMNTSHLTAFTSEFDKATLNSSEYIQLAEDTTTDAFKNSNVTANIQFIDAKDIKQSFDSSSIKMLSYPKAVAISADNAFSNTNSLKYVSMPQVSSFTAQNAFNGRNNSTALSIDMRKYRQDGIPELDDNFFKNGNDTYLSNFNICVPQSKYGDWAAAQNWNRFNGKFDYDEYKTSDYAACNIRESLSTAQIIDRANLPYLQFRTSGLVNKSDKIIRVAVQTASDGGSGGHLPAYENLKLVALLAGDVRIESLPISYDGSYNTKLEFIFNTPIPADRTQVIEFQFFNNNVRVDRMRIVMVDATEWSEYHSIVGPLAGNCIPAIDVYATGIVSVKSYINNPTAALFNEYAFEDTALILNKEKIGGSEVWTLNGKQFEENYGELDTSTTKKQIIFNYTRGQIMPDIPRSLTYMKFDDGTAATAEFSGTLTLDMLAVAIPFDKVLSYIKIGDSVNQINSNVFKGSYFLKTVILPNGLTQLPDGIFDGCENLNAVYLGESLTAISQDAFKFCRNLSALYVPSSVSSLAENGSQFENSGLREIILPDGISELPKNAFANCYQLTSVHLGNRLSALNDGAFCNCTSLEHLKVPGNVKYVGKSTQDINSLFYKCSSLSCIEFRDSVEVPILGDLNAFDYTPDYLSIYVTDNMYNAFCDAAGWDKISAYIFADNYPANNTFIGETTYRITSIDKDIVSANANPTVLKTGILATSIMPEAFLCCSALTAAYINNKITSIGGSAFMSCDNLQYATIPASVAACLKEYGHDDIFRDCSSLATVSIAEGIKDIGKGMFYNAGLTAITLPSTLSGISECAFYGCKNLETLKIPSSVRSIGDNAFTEAGITVFDCIDLSKVRNPSVMNQNAFAVIDDDYQIYVDPSKVDAWKQALPSLADHITVDPHLTQIVRGAATTYEDIVGTLTISELDSPESITALIVGTNVSSIVQGDSSTTTKLINLQNLKISEGCKNIGDNVFNAANNLAEVYIPSSIKTIGKNAFANCQNLSNVEFADGVAGVVINNNAFDACIGTLTFGFGTYTLTTNLVSGTNTIDKIIIHHEEGNFAHVKQRFDKFEYLNSAEIEYVKVENKKYGPLCFKATIQNSQIQLKASLENTLTLEEGIHLVYSTDNQNTWKEYKWNGNVGEVITIANDNDKVYFRAKNYNATLGRSEIHYLNFVTVGRFEVYGNIQTLLNCTGNESTVPDFCFYKLFQNCNITTAPNLPGLVLGESCYREMFANCTQLKVAPELPAETMAPYCYADMFSVCVSLTKAPALNSKELAPGCYARMFKGCKLLTTAPELLAVQLYENCYNGMFQGCSSLLATPDLANPITYSQFAIDDTDKCFTVKLSIDDIEDSTIYKLNSTLADIKEFIEQDVQSQITGEYNKDNGVWTDQMTYVYTDTWSETDTEDAEEDAEEDADTEESTEHQQIFKYIIEDITEIEYDTTKNTNTKIDVFYSTLDVVKDDEGNIIYDEYGNPITIMQRHMLTQIDVSCITNGLVVNAEYNANTSQITATVNRAGLDCYSDMFTDCTQLHEARLQFMDIMPHAKFVSYGAWMNNVAETGTIWMPSDADTAKLIPPGWTREDIE